MRWIAKAAGMASVAALGLGVSLGAARADGYPPFYGYSDYFGGPRVYFTPDDTIRETTSEVGGEYGFGTRTYYRGGPFWGYGRDVRRPVYASRERVRRHRRASRRR